MMRKKFITRIKEIPLIICIVLSVGCMHTIYIDASSPDCTISFDVTTNQTVYQKGQCIHIYGNISVSDTCTIPDNVHVTISHNQWRQYCIAPIQNNSYECTYTISYGDPEGSWNITVNFIDQSGSSINCTNNITVIAPPDILRYTVVVYSPPENAIYYRGNTINISVYVSEAGNGVTNATTTCILSSLESIDLIEIKKGYYQGSYTIPWDKQIGYCSLTIESIKQVKSGLKAGGSSTSIQVKPATLNLTLIKPTSFDFFVGDKIDIKANVSYPDGNEISNAVFVVFTQNQNVTLVNQVNGTYEQFYQTTDEDKGSWFIEFYVSDRYGNTASLAKMITILSRETIHIPFSTILGALVLSCIGFFALYIFRKGFSVQQIENIEKEIEEEKKLQKETAIKYFKNGTISRMTYDALMKEHSERLTDLNKEKRKMKKNNIFYKRREH
jgi:hypothetical protein